MNKEIVVAKYKEDISWLGNIDDSFVKTVYDKSDSDLPNIGREAHTYLHHIINNYDSLAEYTFFLQGNPLNHCPKLLTKIKTTHSFSSLGKKRLTCDINGNPQHKGLNISKGLEEAKLTNRKQIIFTPGAQFVVSRETIMNNSLSYYKNLMKYVTETEDAPWVMERIWELIFTSGDTE